MIVTVFFFLNVVPAGALADEETKKPNFF